MRNGAWLILLLGVCLRVEAQSLPSDLKRTFIEPAEPIHIAGPIHFVGTRGLGVYLITTPEGHILIDGGMPGSEALFEDSIRKLGFELRDIRWLLVTHAHFDHVGTLAHFQKVTGARVAVMKQEAALLASGGSIDYLYAKLPEYRFEPVTAQRLLEDGDTIELGGVTLTARLTPGHTRGCTTWVTTVQEEGTAYRVVFPCSTSVNPGTRLVDGPSYPGIADDYRRALEVLASLDADIALTGHPLFHGFEERRSRAESEGVRAFVDREDYRAQIEKQVKRFETAMAKQAAR